jgi:hypothetical protein
MRGLTAPEFVQLWNVIAAQYGLAPASVGSI